MEDTRAIQQEDSFQQPKPGDEGPTKTNPPKRIIHFANGDTMEEYSTEDEEEEEWKKNQSFDTSQLSWGPFLWLWAIRIASTSFSTCEFLGGRLATFFGLNEPKYQYALDEYYRTQNQDRDSESEGDDPKLQQTDVSSEKWYLGAQGKEYGSIE
ncbi:protein FAM177B [Tachyglossus aculeatus]|uniref:protein FAM177B n=1 Tax=Tachyglossus aculeatus TaxID=9261 RepID=UPI0018F35F1C|nr:protein FAM177B [Tachyglossus aculeatus]